MKQTIAAAAFACLLIAGLAWTPTSSDLSTGNVTTTGNITATGTVQGADVAATDDGTITDDLYAGGNLNIEGDTSLEGDTTTTGSLSIGAGDPIFVMGFTSGTIAASASTCTITLDWAFDSTRDNLQYSIIPTWTAGGSAFAGWGDDFIVCEGGTTIECGITSATAHGALAVYVQQVRLK